ncbi:MAG: polysaccharide pyruvyl transferase CsaB [Candidatus Acetothermia bacterium]
METRKQIAISGYYGYGNLGDEAILEAMVKGLIDRFGDERIRLVVLSDDPEETEKAHGVSAIDRWSPTKIFRTLRHSDLLISGGGGLFQDRTSSFSLWYYLAIIWLARLLRTPVYIIGQGIGPIKHWFNDLFFRWTVNQANGALVRDPASYELLEETNLNSTNIRAGADLAFLLPEGESGETDFFEDERPTIVAAALRDDIRGKMDVVRAVSSGLDLLHKKFGVTVVLFSTNPIADKQINHDLRAATDTDCNVIDVPHLTPRQLVEMMKGIDLIIGGRLHAVIFSLLSGTPVQGISYDPKMDHLIHEINESVESATIPLWHPDELINARDYLANLEDTYENKDSQRAGLEKVRKELELEAREGLETALSWIHAELEHE